MEKKEEMAMKVTKIHSSGRSSKYPISTTGDPTIFKFENTKVLGVNDLEKILQEEFILSFPLDIEDSFISERDGSSLSGKFAGSSELMFVDFDKAKSRSEAEAAARLFVPYNSIFFFTQNSDGIVRNDFRAVFEVEDFTVNDHKRAEQFIRDIISKNGLDLKIEVLSAKPWQFIAPTKINKIFRVNEGNKINKREIKDFVQTRNIKAYKPAIYPEVHKIFEEYGFFPTSKTSEPKVHFMHEETGDISFVWYANSPFSLWHWNKAKNVNISAVFRKRHRIQDFIEKQDLATLTKTANDTNHRVNNKFRTNFLNFADYSGLFNIWKKSRGVFCLKSPMGTGKSEALARALNLGPKTLVITPRVSLAVELATRMGATVYTEAERADGSVCCQFDSLYKFDLSKFDTLVIDEFMTLESHILNTASKSHNFTNTSRLLSMLANPKIRVMLVDALLSENVLDLFLDRDVYWNENEWRDPIPLISHKTFESFLKELSMSLGRRITVSCVSKQKSKGIEDFLNGCGHRARVIDSDLTIFERQEILEEFSRGDLTAIVYSPTLSVGINILCPVDRHFHYDPGNVVTPIQSIQMMRRSRKVEQIDCFVGSKKVPGCLSVDEIRETLKQSPTPTPFINITEFGVVNITPAGKVYSWMNLHDNLWRWDPRESFDLLTSMNFHVVRDAQVLGSEEFTGINFKVYKESASIWEPRIRELIRTTIGDKFELVERFLAPNEVENFLFFNNMMRSYKDPMWRRIARSRAPFAQYFDFDEDFREFSAIMDRYDGSKIKKPNLLKKMNKEKLDKFGIDFDSGVFLSSAKFKTNFMGLYEEIWK